MIKDIEKELRLPIEIRSPARFAVVGPGLPMPTVILSSGDNVSDLAGFYSVREAGLGGILEAWEPIKRDPLELIYSSFSKETLDNPSIHAIDFTVNPKDGKRSEIFSLIFDLQASSLRGKKIIEEYSDQLRVQLERLSGAFANKNHDEMVYIGQILSTFLTVAVRKMEAENSRYERKRFIFNLFIVLYGVVAIGSAVLFLIMNRWKY